MNFLRQSTSAEKPLQASKWLQTQALINENELARLLQTLEETVGPFFLFSCGAVCPNGQGEINKENFINIYASYIQELKNGTLPDLLKNRSLFSPVITTTTDALFQIPVGEDKRIIRVSNPVIQLQAHHLDYSTVDKKFHAMVFGNNSIPWGIQFSYPQLYQDNTTKEVEMVRKSQKFPNTALFQALQKWMRQNTIPTPFIAEGKQMNVPMRLGKECLSWINQHPSLQEKNIQVKL